MISSFQQYLVDNGFRRYTYEIGRHKEITFVDNVTSMSISTFGPVYYIFEKGETKFYWGLGVMGHSPYYYYPSQEHYKMVLSGDYNNDMIDIIAGNIGRVDIIAGNIGRVFIT
jgi:hypothetical protein